MKLRRVPFYQRFFRDLFTGRDGKTYDMGRVLWFQSVQAFILISGYALYKGGGFDPVLWGAGLAALMASGGAALGLKSGTEPEHHGMGDFTDSVEAVTSEVTRVRQTSASMRAADTTQDDSN